MAKLKCGQLTGKVVGDKDETSKTEEPAKAKEEKMTKIMVGRKAPDFEAPAYVNGEIKMVKLSDYLGKWVVLCFYPGDYTFV